MCLLQEQKYVSIIESYVKLLIDEKEIDLVAGYVATLPKSLQVHWYAKFLEGNIFVQRAKFIHICRIPRNISNMFIDQKSEM